MLVNLPRARKTRKARPNDHCRRHIPVTDVIACPRIYRIPRANLRDRLMCASFRSTKTIASFHEVSSASSIHFSGYMKFVGALTVAYDIYF